MFIHWVLTFYISMKNARGLCKQQATYCSNSLHGTNHRIFQHFCYTFKLCWVLIQSTPWGTYFLFSVQHYWRSVFCSLDSYIISSTNTISLSSCFVGWDLWVSEFFKMTASADKVLLAHFQLIFSSIKTSFSVMFLPICFCHSSTWIHTIKSDIGLCRHHHNDT